MPEGRDPIEVVPYDQRWEKFFAVSERELRVALAPFVVEIEHIGSTAVPGLAAKPVIDIQVSVPDVDDEAAYRAPIERIGLPMRSREPGHRYFRTPKGALQRIQVHVCPFGGTWERDHLLFRDYLRAHPQVAATYGSLKRALAARYGQDRLAYTEGKTPFIRAAVARAEDWARATGWKP